MTMKKKVGIIIVFAFALLVVVIALIIFRGRKPFKGLEILSATVRLLPPDETIQIVNLEALEELLEDIVIYNRDHSYGQYNGQAVKFTIFTSDGSQMKVNAYNPFIIIDGTGYRCKYEPCEKLSSYANELLNDCSSGKETDVGTINFYSEPTREGTEPEIVSSLELTIEQERKIKRIIDNVKEWTDDHSVDRLAYYYDGEIKLSGREFIYYFTYEYNVVYYDHYFAEISENDMNYIKSITEAK